jgi:hypothetical protein
MEEEKAATPSTELMTARQLDKLELEIRCLRNNISWLARLVPLLTVIAVVLSFGFGIYEIRTGFDNNVQISEKEFRRKFYEEQFARYLDLAETAARLSTLEDQSKLQEETRRLLELRNGKLIILAENQQILDAIDKVIEALGRDNSKPEYKKDVLSAARALAVVCRESVVRFWQIPGHKL